MLSTPTPVLNKRSWRTHVSWLRDITPPNLQCQMPKTAPSDPSLDMLQVKNTSFAQEHGCRQRMSKRHWAAAAAAEGMSSVYWHCALVNSSHFKCCSVTINIQNLTKLEDVMSDNLCHTFHCKIEPYSYLTKHLTSICTKQHYLCQALYVCKRPKCTVQSRCMHRTLWGSARLTSVNRSLLFGHFLSARSS